MPTTHFTADTHFGHENILRFCSRPFATIEEHDECIIASWNAIVRPGDTIYHIGDFAHRCHPRRLRSIFDRLIGEKHLVIGNHDRGSTRTLPWASVSERVTIAVDGQRLVLDHYPGRSWNGSNRGAVQLYGHVHGNIPDLWNACDVGIDRWGYAPTSWPLIAARLADIPRPEPVPSTDEDEDETPAP